MSDQPSNLLCLKPTSVIGRSDRKPSPDISEELLFYSLLDFTDSLQWESFSSELMASDVLIKEFGADSDLMRDESVSGFVTAEPTPPV